MEDFLQLKGIFEMKIYKGGILIEEYCDNNLIVNLGKEKICSLLANDGVENFIRSIAFGSSTISPTVADTTITDEYAKDIEGFEYPDQKSVKFNWLLDTSEDNGASISEFGLKCFDGTLFSRKTRGTIQKESDVFLSGSWTITVL